MNNVNNMSKVPPHSIEAEQLVLGAMIINKDVIIDVVEIIQAPDFYRESHQLIFEHILKLFNSDAPIDVVTLSDSLIKEGKFELVGGHPYLSELSNAGIVIGTVSYHAKIIQQKSILRHLINSSANIMNRAYDCDSADELLENAEETIFNISKDRNKEEITPIAKLLESTYKNIEQLSKSEGGLTGVSTGFIELDRKTNGLQKSDFILVAARPSMGKTAFSVNVCQNVAKSSDGAVVMFSLEMSKEQLVHRMISSEAHIELAKIRRGDLNDKDWVKITKAMGVLLKSNIFVDDTPVMTVMEMRAKCRRLQLKNKIDLIMVDYLQLMSGSANSREQEIAAISRGLKALAREMDCPVIALSQLSRAPEQRTDHRPMLSDLRESGAIEQDADVVMFLYRDEYYHEDSDKKGIGELIIAKQRNGETGKIELTWMGAYTKFANLYKDNM